MNQSDGFLTMVSANEKPNLVRVKIPFGINGSEFEEQVSLIFVLTFLFSSNEDSLKSSPNPDLMLGPLSSA